MVPSFTKGDLQRAFERAKDPERKPSPGQPEHTEEIDPEKLEQAREKKDELEKRQREQEQHRKDRGPDRDPGDRGRCRPPALRFTAGIMSCGRPVPG